MFSQQLTNLRLKGQRLQLMHMMDDKIIQPMAERCRRLNDDSEEGENAEDSLSKEVKASLDKIMKPVDKAPADQKLKVFKLLAGLEETALTEVIDSVSVTQTGRQRLEVII